MPQNRNWLMDESPIPMSPSLAAALGVEEAIILQQIHFWISIYRNREEFLPEDNRRHYFNGHWWVYNTIQTWTKQFFFLPERSLKRYLSNLREKGVLLVCQPNKTWGNHTNWYAIDHDKLDEVMQQWRTDRAKMAQSPIVPNWPDRFGQNGPISITDITESSNNQLHPETPSASPELDGSAAIPGNLMPGKLLEGERLTYMGGLYAGGFTYHPPVELALDESVDTPDNNSEMVYTRIGGQRKPFQHRGKGKNKDAPASYSLFERAFLKAGHASGFTKKERKTIGELEVAMMRVELLASKHGGPAGYPSMVYINGAILWAYKNEMAVGQLIAAIQNMSNWDRHVQMTRKKGATHEIEYESGSDLTNE